MYPNVGLMVHQIVYACVNKLTNECSIFYLASFPDPVLLMLRGEKQARNFNKTAPGNEAMF